RTYTQPDFQGQMRTARVTADGILGFAGIQVEWLECGPGPDGIASPAACSQPLRPDELAVRIVSAGTGDAGPGGDTLGMAFVDVETGGGSLATVFADRVRSMAQTACVGAAELLGRTMAHEIGHLLLG